MSDDTDYILLSQTLDKKAWLVMVMACNPSNGEYTQTKVSQRHPLEEARRVAQLWAAPRKLRIVGDPGTTDAGELFTAKIDTMSVSDVFNDHPESWDALKALSETFGGFSGAAQLRALAYTLACILMEQEDNISEGEIRGRILLSHDDRVQMFLRRMEVCYRAIRQDENAKKMLGPKGGAGGVN